MKIVGTEGLTQEQIRQEILKGGKFVVYPWCVSVFVMSFKRSSDIHFVRSNQRFTTPWLGYLLLSLLGGWWGVPWGPIWTVQCLWTNVTGGHDVTPEVLAEQASAS